MENASKALIIAGAILLAILLISLGIMIFNQAQDTVSSSGMSQAQVTAFNNQFIKYEGDKKGTMVKSMIQEVLAVNADSSENDGLKLKVSFQTNGGNKKTVIGDDSNADVTSVTSYIVNNNTYSIDVKYGTDGRINELVVDGTFSGSY